MTAQRQRRAQSTLLEQIPHLRIGGEADRNAFWVITSIVALTLLWSVVIDLVVHWSQLVNDTLLFWITAAPIVPAILWAVIPWLLRDRFPRVVGSVGFFIAILVVCHNLAYSNDAVLAITALHILPIVSLYLGWFWTLGSAIGQYSIAMTLVTASAIASDVIGEHEAVSPSTAVFGILLSTFAFSIGVYLRYRLKKKALTDQLTGVWNARGIRRRLTIEIERAAKKHETLSVAFCDFDNFKLLNDTKGHAYGDLVLQRSVEKWRHDLRPYDVIGRLGGDEFIIIFPKTTRAQAANILHRIHDSGMHPWTWGVAETGVQDTGESLLARADEALYQNKNLRETSPDWMASSVETDGTHTRRDEQANLILRFFRSQSEFSIVSSMLALVACGGILASIIGGDYARSTLHTPMEGWISLAIATLGVAIPLTMGAKYPRVAGIFIAALLLVFYTLQSITSVSLYSGITLMFALSLVALYLGTFFGSVFTRLLLVIGVIAVITPIWIRATSVWTVDHRPIVVVTALYSILMCVVLFELGSYLYIRSRTHANHDELTGALNRYGLNEFGNAEVSRARRTGQPLSVAVIDCVGFKTVNDTRGHAAGDALLRELVIYFTDALNVYDHIARIGGDEFALIFPYRNAEEAEAFLAPILQGAPSQLRCGVAELNAQDTLASLLERADQAVIARTQVNVTGGVT